MARAHKPRSGSLQFWPRKRAKRIYPRVKSWAKLDRTSLLGFLGYKVGMTHVQVNEYNPSLKSTRLVIYPVTIIECPPIKVLGIKFYKNTIYGLRDITTIYSENLSKELKRKITLPKKIENKFPEFFDDLRLIIYTQPRLTTINKKKPEILEIALSGMKEEKFELAKNLLNKEIKANDVFKQNQNLDIHAVTKGKGFQGPLKRFGLQLKSHKSEKKRRAPGNLGSWTPKKILFTVPQAGQMGFQTRIEYNKTLLKISNNPEEVNPKSGFNGYGLVKNDYLLIKGSIPGPSKRLIVMTYPLRDKKPLQMEVKYIKK
ncbi:MAG: 50S ribosomal protein L3 [Nanoarchaeota archaeon]